jgi:cytosine/adenosine deaminase-related metal-dependent hydrolase
MAAAAVALGELALTGCTTAADHHYVVPGGDDSVFDAIGRAARTVGIRAHIARGSMDLGQSRGGLPPDSVVEDLDAILSSTEAVHARLHDGERVVVTVAPCSPFSVTSRLMTESASLARGLGLRLHTHLAETLGEERDALARFGRRPVALLDEWGWIAGRRVGRPRNPLDDAEVARLGASGTGVAHCPSSNCRLGSASRGPSTSSRPVCTRRARASTAWPPTRSAASCRSCGWRCSSRASAASTRRVFGPLDALRLATEGGARCLGRDDVGRLEPGLRADVVVWPGDDLADVLDPLAGLILGPERRARHVLVDGEYVVRDGALVGADLGALRAELTRRARRLWPGGVPREPRARN